MQNNCKAINIKVRQVAMIRGKSKMREIWKMNIEANYFRVRIIKYEVQE